MGRVYEEVREDGRGLWTMFDTGSKNTYIVRSAAETLHRQHLPESKRVGIGGRVRLFDEACIINGYIQGKLVNVTAFVIDELGRDDAGRPVELLFGALAMQQWGIRPIPDEERIDVSHYPEEFIEY